MFNCQINIISDVDGPDQQVASKQKHTKNTLTAEVVIMYSVKTIKSNDNVILCVVCMFSL